MNKRTNFFNFKVFVAALFCFFVFSNVFAASTTAAADKLARSLVATNLSAQLKRDLAKSDVTVKLSNVNQEQISKNTIAIKGDAFCLFDNEDIGLPVRFEAKIDVAQKTVSNIDYDFVEASTAAAPEYAPTSNEEFLMKELMKQISRDYKTENIVVALDGVEGNQSSIGEKQFTGAGEVRIGDLEWNRIKFNVVVDQSGRAKKIVYDVKK